MTDNVHRSHPQSGRINSDAAITLIDCGQRGIPVDGIRLIQRAAIHPVTGLAEIISLDIQLPPDFPEVYKVPVIRAAEPCKVKKHFESPPEIEVATSVNPSVPA